MFEFELEGSFAKIFDNDKCMYMFVGEQINIYKS